MKRIFLAGFKVFRTKKSGFFFLTILLFPVIVAILSIFFNINLNNVADKLISGVSIFIGVLFSLIILIAGKSKEYKQKISHQNIEDSEINNAKAHLNFAKELIAEISLSIMITLFLIIALVCSSIYIDYGMSDLNVILTQINLFFIVYFSVLLLFITIDLLKSMFSFFMMELSTKNTL